MTTFANPLDRLIARAQRPVTVRCLPTFDGFNIARGPGVVFDVLTFHDQVGIIQASSTRCCDQARAYLRQHHHDYANGIADRNHQESIPC